MGYDVDLKEVVEKEYPDTTIYQVWYCKTLQNKKGLYYLPKKELYLEATFNGDKQEVYIDEYIKTDNKIIRVNH